MFNLGHGDGGAFSNIGQNHDDKNRGEHCESPVLCSSQIQRYMWGEPAGCARAGPIQVTVWLRDTRCVRVVCTTFPRLHTYYVPKLLLLR